MNLKGQINLGVLDSGGMYYQTLEVGYRKCHNQRQC
jgi:hypothetical protein